MSSIGALLRAPGSMAIRLLACLALATLSPSRASAADVPATDTLAAELLATNPQLVDAGQALPALLVDLRYSTLRNFTKTDIYGSFGRCLLHRQAAAMLARATELLDRYRPAARLLLLDCLRPWRFQKVLWSKVKGTPRRRFVANPFTRLASLHNWGCAVDLTLADPEGQELDMGGGFDQFDASGEPRAESALLRTGKLTGLQLGNRLALRLTMVEAGFLPLASEWWHFNCSSPRSLPKTAVRVP